MKRKNKKFWSHISNLAILISIVAGAVAIFTYLYPEREHITAVVDYGDYIVPHETQEFLWEKARGIKDEDIEKLLPPKIENRKEIVSNISGALNKDKEQYNRVSHLLSGGSIVLVYIRNNGKKGATNLTLETPFQNGHYMVYRRGSDPANGDFKNNVNLGDLRPDEFIQVVLWNEDILRNTEELVEYVRVVYPDGIVKVDVRRHISPGLWLVLLKLGYVGFIITAILIGVPLVFISLVLQRAVKLAFEQIEIDKLIKDKDDEPQLKSS